MSTSLRASYRPVDRLGEGSWQPRPFNRGAHHRRNRAARGQSSGVPDERENQLKSFNDERSVPSRFRMDIKSTITTAGSSGGPTGGQAFRDQINGTLQRRMRVRDLLSVIGISTGSVEYPQQTLRTNAAAMVAEGNLKPESAYGWTMQTVVPRVIAHWVPASRQILNYAPQLKGADRHGIALRARTQGGGAASVRLGHG